MSLLGGGGYFKIDLEILPSWDYVGTFSVLGRVFFAFACFLTPCWAFVAHAGRFLAVLGRSGSDFGASRDKFEGSETSFFEVLSRAQACNANKLRMCKNHSFS